MAFLLNPWRSHVQRICFLAIKIIFLQLTFTTLLLEILDRDNPFPLETSQSKTLNTIKLGLISGVLLESLVSIALNGLLPCIVVLALNAVELGILSWLATGLVDSSDGGASISATVSLVFSGLFFILRLADVFLLSSSMTSLMAPSDLLMLQVQYKPPHWERWLRRFGGSSRLRLTVGKGVVAVATLSIVAYVGFHGKVPRDGLRAFIPIVFILSHGLLSFFITPYLHRMTDLFLIILEGITLFLGGQHEFGDVAFIIARLILFILLCITLTLRIWDIVMDEEPTGLLPLDMLGKDSIPVRSPRVSLLLGRKAWHELSLKGEPGTVKFLRGSLAILALGALLVFSIVLISGLVATEGQERGLKEFQLMPDAQTWGVYKIFLRKRLGHMIFPEATNVTQSCWNQNRSSRTTNSTCYITNDTYDNLCYRCDPNYDFFGSNSKLTTSVQGMSCETRVELDLTFFDFTGLPEMFRAIDIQVADVNVTEADLRHVPTFTIRKNEKLVGDADVFIKEIFRQSSPLNTFGYGGPIKRINVAEFPRVRIDDIAGGGGTNSSLRFFTRSWADNPVSGPTVRLVKEYNDNTVLDLFANLGGLWTFANGIFALVFGGSLLYFLLGIKPLSRFGFIHLFFQKRLRTATQEHYPRFFEEGGQPGDHDAGVVAFIREHLVGVLSEERGSHPDGSHIQDASLSTMVDASSTHRMSRPPSVHPPPRVENMENISLEPLRSKSS